MLEQGFETMKKICEELPEYDATKVVKGRQNGAIEYDDEYLKKCCKNLETKRKAISDYLKLILEAPKNSDLQQLFSKNSFGTTRGLLKLIQYNSRYLQGGYEEHLVIWALHQILNGLDKLRYATRKSHESPIDVKCGEKIKDETIRKQLKRHLNEAVALPHVSKYATVEAYRQYAHDNW